MQERPVEISSPLRLRPSKRPLNRADGGEEKEGETAIDAQTRHLNSDFARKWGPLLLLAPTLPAMQGILIVSIGSTILHANPIDTKRPGGYCGEDIDTFLSLTIANSYLLLLVYAWSFLGFEVELTIRGKRRTVLRPFGHLRSLAIAYFIPLLFSFIVFIYGTWVVGQASMSANCRNLNGLMLGFCTYLMITYWIGVVYSVLALFGKMGSKAVTQAGMKAAGKVKSLEMQIKAREEKEDDEIVVNMVKEKWIEFDRDDQGYIDSADLEMLLERVGLFTIKGRQLQKLAEQLDSEGEQQIHFKPFVEWFKKNMKESEAGESKHEIT